MSYIVNLADADASLSSVIGGKGAMLGELVHTLPFLPQPVEVPEGFGIAADAFAEWMHSAGIKDTGVAAALRSVGKDVKGLGELSKSALTALENTPVPESLVNEVQSKLGKGLYAVRSSGIGEDGANMSFAGEHDSFLQVKPKDVADNIRKVWLSTFAPRVLYYRAANELYDAPLRQGVVVMDMVNDPEMAGVAFSVDTRTGSRKHGLIEYVKGLADKLVAGEVTPETIAFLKGEKLDSTALNQVAQTVCELEKKFEWPADIEWAYSNGILHLLQLRPLTALPEALSDEQIDTMEMSHPEYGIPTKIGAALAKGQATVRGFVSREQARDKSGRWKLDKRLLLVPFTTPDDMDILEKVAGVVVSRGGATSHAAITCREFNKPCMKVDTLKAFNHNNGTGWDDFSDTVKEGYLDCNLQGARAAWYKTATK